MNNEFHSNAIRAKVVCVFRDGKRILVGKFHDPKKNEAFHCPPGGGIEFGESSKEAIRREIREELGSEIEDPRLLGILENVFTYDGRRGHEIVFVYDARLTRRELYDVEQFCGYESNGEAYDVTWLNLETMGPQTPPVYPDGLLELITKELG